MILVHDITKHRAVLSLSSSHILPFYIVLLLVILLPPNALSRKAVLQGALPLAEPVMAPLEVLEHGQRPSLEAGWRRFQLLVAVIMACPANEA
jgi:hypothetical protein